MDFMGGTPGLPHAGAFASFSTSSSASSASKPLHLRPSNDAGSAASRQKSCNTCVRGKRRCDKRMPRCTRCAAKNLECAYRRQPPPLKPAAPAMTVTVDTSSSSMSLSTSEGSTPEMFGLESVGFDLGDLSGDTSPESLQPQDVGLQFDEGSELNFSVTDFLSHDSTGVLGIETMGCGMPLWDPRDPADCHKIQVQAPSVSVQPEPPQQPIRDLSLLRGCARTAMDLDVDQVHDPRSKIGFIVQEFSGLHVTFAQKRSTPFMHPRLYAAYLPKTILIAFSAASSYASRTQETKGWVMRMLQYAVKEVYREGEKATTAVERLARVQALLMLNSIRIFDGDVGSRAAAEREMSVMTAWARDLVPVRIELEDGLPAAVSMTKERLPKSWESWILLESLRRTVITAFSVICLLYLLKNGEAPPGTWQDNESFTASRHLWEAPSSVEFFRAWREKRQYCVTNGGFKEFWEHARPEDMDDFTRIMLTPQVGVEAIGHFLTGEIEIPV